MRRVFLAALAAAMLLGRCASAPPPEWPTDRETYALAGEHVIPTDTAFPAAGRYQFGGISGLALVRGKQELLAISDDQDDSRIFRLRWSGEPGSFSITPTGTLLLQSAPGTSTRIDPEGIAISDRGTILVSTEGIGASEPRTPPSINEYAPDGRFIGEFSVPARFFPNERGPLSVGVRANGGFESLTMSPDFRALYTANELPLAQDADDAVVAQGGGQVRLLRYARSETGMGYAPQQQFAYEIAPLEPTSFKPQLVVNGLVELLALRDGELLALERAFVQAADPQQSINRVRIYRISLSGATDVSLVNSLKTGSHKPVKKTLIVDLAGLQGLSPALRQLDNFEALTFIPAGPGGGRLLMVASDNNFNARQVTAFLLLSTRR